MKKKVLLLVLTVFTCLTLVAYGNSENQKEFLKALPQMIQQTQNNNSAYNSSQVFPNVITTTSVQKESPRTTANPADLEQQMAGLAYLYKYVDQKFLYDIDYNAVYEAMATAMFNALGDEYSVFVPVEEEDDYELSMLRQYAGAGFVLSKYYEEYQKADDISTLYCKLTQVYPNTPASKSGLKAGDYITHIDGESVIQLSSTECSSRIKGDAGTTVTLTILRNEKSFDVEIVREIITIPELYYCMLDGNVGYLYILQFIADTDLKVEDAILDLQKQGMEKLIIDLRDNPGGMVQTTLKIADMFLSGGKPIMVTNYLTEKTTDWSSSYQLVKDDIPIAVLVNEGSASSSEILASALRDNGRAVLIGTRTFGKGISQTTGLWGENEFKLTTASFTTPNGDEIQKVGLPPDIEIEATYLLDEEVDAYNSLMKTGLITDYVTAHPDLTKENVEGFALENRETGLRNELLNILVWNEYIDGMTTDEAPIADPWFDVQLAKALEYFKDK